MVGEQEEERDRERCEGLKEKSKRRSSYAAAIRRARRKGASQFRVHDIVVRQQSRSFLHVIRYKPRDGGESA